MPCPECGTELTQYPERDKWRCTTCSGALVGTSELDLDVVAPTASTTAPRPCPRCKDEMFAFEVGPLTLDRCAVDGLVWFDRGELGQLRSALANPIEGWAETWAQLVRFAL